MINILSRKQFEEENPGRDYDDWHYESIRFRYHPDKTKILRHNTERIGAEWKTDYAGQRYQSWPAMIEEEVENVWKWSQTIDTGGYWEVYDVERDGHGLLNRCSCNSEQFVSYMFNNNTKEREEMECPHCWLKAEQEDEWSPYYKGDEEE